MKRHLIKTLVICCVLVSFFGPAQAEPNQPPREPWKWVKYASNPVFQPSGGSSWDSEIVFGPAVLYDGSTYRMWYTGGPPYQIGLATSNNGIAWTREVSNPVLAKGGSGSWDEAAVRFATVIYDGGTYKMWYEGRSSAGLNQIGYATSPDGVVWTKHAGNPVFGVGSPGSWDDRYIAYPTVIKDGSTYKMWYAGRISGKPLAIGYATSSDGITWTRYSGNPVLSPSPAPNWDYQIYAPRVILVDSVYHLWYSGENFVSTLAETGYARSTDGIHWVKRGPVIQQGPDGAFDRYSADYATVLLVGSVFKMWYSGWGDYYAIGYAEAPAVQYSQSIYMPVVANNLDACAPLWSDGFSDYHSGWPIVDESEIFLGYGNNEYQIQAKQLTDWFWWTTSGFEIGDSVLAVDLRFASGSGAAGENGGILFGKSKDDDNNFYRFEIQRNGQYCIQRHDDPSGWHDLKCGTASNYQPYPSKNRLKVLRSGSTIKAYLNDQLLASATDATYTGSLRVGLIAGSSGTNGDLRFDNYAVYPAACVDAVH